MAVATGSMGGKTVVVTGATSRIGEFATRELSGMGARVALIGLSAGTCEATAAMIRRATSNPAVDYLVANLSSRAAVRRLAADIKVRYPRVDVLANNAGAMISPRTESVAGLGVNRAWNQLGSSWRPTSGSAGPGRRARAAIARGWKGCGARVSP